ncbi:1-phosphofructokinase [Antrihabitans cavernicola]|uniref:1-phosphofructokinase n=1 Tax=Antrihabitans cavernicola TaxID=2495913 RepID=A0A5A7S9H0_9NOCA|nr:1-phosphofructokinase [Spelaeibacter cavernicola]KAA0021899.1 1-phosphofructokinase [Spelaeibacter cavernicola]
MIITLTANPSIDRTVALAEPLERGAVHRTQAATSDPGGKGVNVARVVANAGASTIALLPGNEDDPLLKALREIGIGHRTVPSPGTARINLTITEPDGTTTKINQAGTPLPHDVRARLAQHLHQLGAGAAWVVLAGSLPPGVPDDWYADLIRSLRDLSVRVAVDTSDDPLRALALRLDDSAPHLMKPNAEELAQLTGFDAELLEQSAAQGDPTLAATASRVLIDKGVEAVLATLGAAGAVLVTRTGAWYATPPPIVPRSTVGAGDSSLAGYLLAHLEGADPPGCLRRAVAYGAAAAALPGTALPAPRHLNLDAVTVTALASDPQSKEASNV